MGRFLNTVNNEYSDVAGVVLGHQAPTAQARAQAQPWTRQPPSPKNKNKNKSKKKKKEEKNKKNNSSNNSNNRQKGRIASTPTCHSQDISYRHQ